VISDKVWLGIDPGLAIVGWAILTEDDRCNVNLIDFGTIETDKSLSTAQRLTELEQDLIEIIGEFKPREAAIEMPFFGREIKAAGGVLQALGVINLVCYRDANINPIFLHQASWKAHLGHGRATKDDVADMVKILFDLEELPINDAVDAIGIGYAGLCGVRNNID